MQSATLFELISDIHFAMLTTRSLQGELRARPLTTQRIDKGGQEFLWFFVPSHGDVAADITADDTVNVSYANPEGHSYVSVSGRADLVNDQEMKERLWSPMTTIWFPGGSKDPSAGLLRVKIINAHYWNVKTNKVVQLYRMAKAFVDGQPLEIVENGEVVVSQ